MKLSLCPRGPSGRDFPSSRAKSPLFQRFSSAFPAPAAAERGTRIPARREMRELHSCPRIGAVARESAQPSPARRDPAAREHSGNSGSGKAQNPGLLSQLRAGPTGDLARAHSREGEAAAPTGFGFLRPFPPQGSSRASSPSCFSHSRGLRWLLDKSVLPPRGASRESRQRDGDAEAPTTCGKIALLTPKFLPGNIDCPCFLVLEAFGASCFIPAVEMAELPKFNERP